MDYIEKIEAIVGGKNVRRDEIERLCYSRDLSVHEGIPDVIVFAKSAEEVSKILAIANEKKIPVTPRGSGTSAVGGALTAKGGILLDLSRMDNILEVNRRDGYVIAEPGVICNDLNMTLAPTHFFPPDPASATLASLGGMVSTNASGNRALKYGTTKQYVLGLEVVLADGRIISTGSTLAKTSAGYDLTQLFTQSEGTLGIITKVILKILPMPEYIAFADTRFSSLIDAGNAAEEILTAGIALSSCEILDKTSIDVVNKAMGLGIPGNVESILFIEIDGKKQAVKADIRKINKICTANNGIENKWDDDPEKRLKMWAARQGIIASLSKVKRGARLQPVVEDFGVPITKIPQTIREIQKISEKYNFPIATFGHIGDGNLHAVIISDPRNKAEWDIMRKVANDFIDLTLRLEGTLTAEHGIGMAKSPYILRELGESHNVMKDIKKSLDPNNIINPGKMGFDDSIRDIYDNFAFQGVTEGLRSFGKAVDDEIFACIMCGFCRAGCPVYKEISLESKNARGRVILAYNMLKGRIEPSKELAERFYQCTMCLHCKAACPAGVQVADIVESARKRLVEAGYLPEVHRGLLESISKYGNPLSEPSEKRTDVYPSTYVHKAADTLLFFGCVSSYQDIQIVPNTMEILDKTGIDYATMGNEEHCCGYLAYLVGSDQFKDSMGNNVKRFSTFNPKTIVTTCAGCCRTFRGIYPQYSDFNIEVLHAVEYLDRLISEGRIHFKEGISAKAVYHDPCDIGRHMEIYEPPRNIMKHIPGMELVEFKQNRNLANCCGGGGGMKGYDNDLSSALAYKRITEALDIGVDMVISACPACKSNLHVAATRLRKEKKGRIKVMDITEVVAQAIE
ncbi:MAG: FAD-binding protein [Syntrophobacterales bacterium]|nr:MAG: FAD-binding protein [Syntrophobacterales bacterium]